MKIKNNFLKVGISAIAVIVMLAFSTMAFAGSSIADPTKKYSNTAGTLAAFTANDVVIQEEGLTGFTDGYLTIKIPSNVKLHQKSTTRVGTETIARTASVLGTFDAPKNLYLYNSGSLGSANITANLLTTADLCLKIGNTHASLLTVYGSGSWMSRIFFSTSATPGFTYTEALKFSTLADATLAMQGTSYSSSEPVGKIYYDDTTSETVIQLAMGGETDATIQQVVLNDLTLIPAATSTTGDVNLSFADKKANGTGTGLGITADAGVKVATLVTQAVNVAGTAASSSVPTIKIGQVSAQQQGVITITKVGATTTTTTSDKLTFTLDNGATFHSGGTSVGTQAWSDSGGAFTVSGGSLVWTAAATLGIISDATTLTIAAATTNIDASAVSTPGSITCTITGAGQFATVNTTVVIATAATSGTTASFVDDTTAGLSKLYVGRTAEQIGSSEYVMVGEDAPGSLLNGGNVTMTLSQGVYTTSTQLILTGTAFTTTAFPNTALNLDADAATAAATSKTVSISGASTSTVGAFKVSAGSYNLASAAPGILQMTFSGTAGASGTVTFAEVINATTTTTGTTGTIVPGAAFTLPDITIVENAAEALTTTGYVFLHFPSGVTLDTGTAPTVTTTPATSGTASTSTVTALVTANDVRLDVTSASTSIIGAYSIVISGLSASVSSTQSSGPVSFVIGGGTGTTYDSTAFSSNIGAKPTKATVAFGSVVSATVPFADTAVVSGNTVTQTFIPAGNDIGKVGDLYVFTLTPAQYYSGGAWSATATPYSAGGTLGTTSVVYDISAVAASTKIYIGYGTGVSGTESTMNTNGTFVLAYTTAAAPTIVPVVIPATAGAAVTATINTTDTYTLNLATTNAAGATPTAEYVVYQVIVSGTPSGWWFMTPTGSVQYVPGLDPTTVTYDTAAAGSISLGDFLLGTYLPTAGDELILVYAYATGTVDFTDPTTFEVENVVTMTVQ